MTYLSLEGGGSRDDLQNLRSDGRLTRPVVLLTQALGEGPSVVAGALHALHPGGELGRDRLLERPKDLAVQVQGQDGIDDLEGVLLEDHVVGEILQRSQQTTQPIFSSFAHLLIFNLPAASENPDLHLGRCRI